MKKIRLDKFISQNFPNFTREKARECIKNNFVCVDDQVINTPSFLISENIESSKQKIYISEKVFSKNIPFVSRGYFKLNSFLEANKSIAKLINNAFILDIGASSGGFTQSLLEYNPKFIIAQDIGKNQFNKILLKENVFSIEEIDIRDFCKIIKHFNAPLTFEELNKICTDLDLINLQNITNKFMSIQKIFQSLKETQIKQTLFDVLVCDVSFISIKNIFADIYGLSTYAILLYKPQFEVGKDFTRNKKGVLKNTLSNADKNRDKILQELEGFKYFLKQNNVKEIFTEKSSIKGKEGNEEFFIFFKF